MAKLNPQQIEAARARGATTTVKPKQVAVGGMDSLIVQMTAIVDAQKNSNTVLLKAIGRLIDVIRDKKLEGTDVSELVKAVMSLQMQHEPRALDYRMTGERDQRGRIDLSTGLIFTAVPSRLDS